MSREEELNELGFQELRDEAKELGLSAAGSKEDLVRRIQYFEAGIPEPEGEQDEQDDAEPEDAPEDDGEAEDGEAAADDADTDDSTEGAAPAASSYDDDESEDDEPAAEAAKADGDDTCLVKYIGKSSMFQAKGYTFSVQHPFVAVKEEVCNSLVQDRPRYFRTATPAEVERFYS